MTRTTATSIREQAQSDGFRATRRRFNTLALTAAAGGIALGRMNYGSAGVGTIHHLAMEMLARQAGFQARHIAYKGSAPAVTDLIGGHIDVMFLDSPTALAQMKGNKIRALAISSAQRL